MTKKAPREYPSAIVAKPWQMKQSIAPPSSATGIGQLNNNYETQSRILRAEDQGRGQTLLQKWDFYNKKKHQQYTT